MHIHVHHCNLRGVHLKIIIISSTSLGTFNLDKDHKKHFVTSIGIVKKNLVLVVYPFAKISCLIFNCSNHSFKFCISTFSFFSFSDALIVSRNPKTNQFTLFLSKVIITNFFSNPLLLGNNFKFTPN